MLVHSTHGKLSIAVENLASSPSSLQSRLESAGYALHSLRVEEFPEELQDDFKEVWGRLTNKPAEVEEEGCIKATTRQLSDEDAEGLAKLIVNLNNQICHHYCTPVRW